MENLPILKELVILLAVALPITFIFHKFNLPTLTGFLITGILIGPGGLKLITDVSTIEILAEIGIVLLMFTIGLEFATTHLVQARKIFLVGGLIQIIGTISLVAIISWFVSHNLILSIFTGFLASLSSTAIVMKELIDRGEVDSPHGRISIAILLFQDLCVIPMMMILPYLNRMQTFEFFPFIKAVAMAVVFLVAIYYASRLVLAGVIDHIARLNNRGLFIISIVVICLGTAFLTASMGLSLAIGAFLAGFILSKSYYSHEIVVDVMPFRDSFSSIFFISVGMLVNVQSLFHNLFILVGGVAGIFILKFLVIVPVIICFGYSLRIAVIIGLSLAQIGEFSFVLAKVGHSYHLISPDYFQTFIAVSIISMLATPLLMKASPRLSMLVQKHLKLALREPEEIVESKIDLKDYVLIVGYGLNGRTLARVLKEVGIKYLILELNPVKIKEAREKGEPVIYGDVTRPDILKKINIENAKVAVLAISDPVATRHGLWAIKSFSPTTYTIVRTRYTLEIGALQQLGADRVIPEEFETSVEIFSRVLQVYHIPRNVILQEVDLVRKEGYRMLRGLSLEPSTLMDLSDIFTITLTETLLIREGSKAAGKTLSGLELRERAGATVIAVVRDGKAVTNPKGDFVLSANDILIVLGNHADLDKAINFISSLEK